MALDGPFGFLNSRKSYQRSKLSELRVLINRARALEERREKINIGEENDIIDKTPETTCPFCGVKGNLLKVVHKEDCWFIAVSHLNYEISKFEL